MASCGLCGRCSEVWDDEERDEEQDVIDPIAMAERNTLDAIADLREALGRCENVRQVLALKQRISALWLAMDALDQDALRKADALLKDAVEIHHQRQVA